jgi:glycosyltransferase involved in cell wall biosynthesis
LTVRVLVDARSALFPERTGVGQYTWQMLRWLPAVDPRTTYVAWSLDARGLGRRTRTAGLLPAAPNLTERRTPIPSRLFDPLARRLGVPRMEWLARHDILFAPNFVPPPTARPVVLMVHDAAFRRAPRTVPRRTARWLSGIERATRRAAAIVVPSEAAMRDLVEAFPVLQDRVSVIPHGVDPDVFQPVDEQAVNRVRRQFGIEGPFFLSLGGLEPRKNLPRLLEAFGRLRSHGPALVVAGSGVPWNPEGSDQFHTALRKLPEGARGRVVLAGYVSEQEKVALLGGATALVYPSLYEGFGLPVLEAMSCGTPVVTSNVSALPEVAGDAALLIDPRHPDEIAAGMQRLLEDEALGASLAGAGRVRAAAFRWEETADRTAAVLHAAAGGGRPTDGEGHGR